ncbi:MAG: NfeD family protein [Phormidesmis sp.]
MFLSSLTAPILPALKANLFPNVSPFSGHVGAKAEVVEPITDSQKGCVQLYGVYWFAQLHSSATNSIKPGCKVTVIGQSENTLIVVPMAHLAI